MEVRGVLICMSEGGYGPVIELIDRGTMQTKLVDYCSQAALESGLKNPRHWAHAVYWTIRRLCEQHQTELQGGSMAEYDGTERDRRQAREVKEKPFEDLE